MRREQLIMLVFIGVVTTGCRTDPASGPNIIYIMADDMGYADAGCYGGTHISTPNLDRLASEGMRFTRHYAGSPVCAPSRCVLMTGLHTGHAASRGNKEADPYGQFPLPDEAVTVAELLQESGYRTGLFGKWGLGVEETEGDPQNQGFDDFYGYYCQVHAHNSFPEYLYRNGQREYLGNEVVYLPEDHWTRGLGSYATAKEQYSNDLIFEEAMDFLQENRDDPFFLYLPVTMPHNNGEALPGEKIETPSQGQYADSSWHKDDKDYASLITRLDGYVGRLLDELDKYQLSGNTLVVFTSDNGGFRVSPLDHNGHLRGMKRDLYEGGIRVPFIARWPGTIEAGSVTDHISAFWDFLPTACEAAGIQVPADIDGLSYLPVLKGEKQKKHEYLYWEFHEQGKKQAVRMGRWKAVRLNVFDDPEAPVELYDLNADPSETEDVSAQHPEIAEQMKKIMGSARTADPVWPLFKTDRAALPVP